MLISEEPCGVFFFSFENVTSNSVSGSVKTHPSTPRMHCEEIQQQEPRCDKESEGDASPLGLSDCVVSVISDIRSPFSVLGPNWALTLAREICHVAEK